MRHKATCVHAGLIALISIGGCVWDDPPGPPPPGSHPWYGTGTGGGTDDGMAGLGPPCNVWSQDCSSGEKCMPIGVSDSGWTAARCSPVAEFPVALGDPCTMSEGPLGGFDDCDEGAFCYFWDAETGEGKCLPFCTGGPLNPQCPSGMACGFDVLGTMALCRAECNPLEQDCEEPNAICRDVPGGDAFACYVQGGLLSESSTQPCTTDNGCPAGSFCAPSEKVLGEAFSGGFRCTPYCDVSDPMVECPLQDQDCVVWFPDDPGEKGKIGACFVP